MYRGGNVYSNLVARVRRDAALCGKPAMAWQNAYDLLAKCVWVPHRLTLITIKSNKERIAELGLRQNDCLLDSRTSNEWTNVSRTFLLGKKQKTYSTRSMSLDFNDERAEQ